MQVSEQGDKGQQTLPLEPAGTRQLGTPGGSPEQLEQGHPSWDIKPKRERLRSGPWHPDLA